MANCGKPLARNICMGLYFFFCGVEYAVILPTINGYLISLGAEQTFLGIVLASFSFGGLVSAPLYGWVADKTGSTKACVIVGNIGEIIGNLMYFIGKNQYLVWSGRLIAGLGSGAASTLFGLISHTTTAKERTSMFAILMGLRQIGLLVGPGFNLFLYKLNFKLGPFVVDENTSPGLFMAILWALHTILFAILFKNIDQNKTSIVNNHSVTVNENRNYGSFQDAETTENIEGRVSIIESGWKVFIREFLREEVIVCLTTAFLAMYVQTGLETAITPMTRIYFNWNGVANSLALCLAGAVVIVSFACVHFLSKCFMDRALLLSGCFGLVVTYAIFFAYVFIMYELDEIETPTWLFPVFLFDCALLIVSISFLFVSQVSLFSKITNPDMQSFNQGVRIVSVRFGQIIGPLWASSLVTTSRLPIMAAVDLGILCILTAMVLLSYKRLISPPLITGSDSESVSLVRETDSD
ncbi:uncharacterized protein LOC120345755 [Styela clava]